MARLCPTLSDLVDCSSPGSSVHGDSPGKNTGVCCHSLPQGIFPTQGSNTGLLHFRQILYRLSHHYFLYCNLSKKRLQCVCLESFETCFMQLRFSLDYCPILRRLRAMATRKSVIFFITNLIILKFGIGYYYFA